MLITIAPDNNTGFRKHLEELTYLFEKYSSKNILVTEKGFNKTLKEIKKVNPSFTIIGGRNWIIRNEVILKSIPGKKGVLYCSPIAQAEISNIEIKNLNIYLKWLDCKKIDYLFVGSEDLAKILNRKNIIYLPAPSKSDLKFKNKYNNLKKNIVAIINDKAVHKNILNSIAGVSLSKKTDIFWINGLSDEYLDLVNRMNFKYKLKNIGFIEKKDFYKTLKNIKLLLQLSFSEGFSYSTFEAMNLGIPVLVSSAINWVNIKELIVDDIQNYKEIAAKIDNILSLNKKEYTLLCNKCKKLACLKIKNNNKICKDNLTKLLM